MPLSRNAMGSHAISTVSQTSSKHWQQTVRIECRTRHLLARHYGGRVVPWVFRYDGMEEALGARYKPWRLLLSWLTAPLGTIHCQRGRSSDLVLPDDPRDRDGFTRVVQTYYARALG